MIFIAAFFVLLDSVLAVAMIHWGITVHDTVSGLAVICGLFFMYEAGNWMIALWKMIFQQKIKKSLTKNKTLI